MSYTFHHRGSLGGATFCAALTSVSKKDAIMTQEQHHKLPWAERLLIMLGILKNKREYLATIPLENIAPNPHQPRKYFSEESLEELKNSILEYGLIQPITVHRTSDGYFELISGERRFRAAARAGLKSIKAYVIESDAKQSAVMSLLENLQREDLSFDEIAQSYESLIMDQHMSKEEIIAKTYTSRTNLANKLRLLRLSPVIRRLIREYNLTEKHAIALLRLPGEKLQLEAAKKVCLQNLSPEQTQKLVDSMLTPPKSKLETTREINIAKINLFSNTVKKAVDMMQQSGIDAKMNQEIFDWGTEYRITVNNEKEIVE